MTAIELVEAERKRQIEKGYDASHDDGHTEGGIALLGASIAATYAGSYCLSSSDETQRWAIEAAKDINSKFKGRSVRLLTIAAALLVAEIERLHRADLSPEHMTRFDGDLLRTSERMA